MNLQSNQLLTVAKAFSRGNDLPLDESSVFDSLEELQNYADTNPTAYDLQFVTVRNGEEVDGYILSKQEDGKFELVGCGPKTIVNTIEQKIIEASNDFATKWEEF